MPRYRRKKSLTQLQQLRRYVVKGKYAKLRALVNGGVNLNLEALDTDLLMIAAQKDDWKIVALLIDCGANIYSCDDIYKWTFLHYAARAGWVPVFQIVVARGYDLEVKTARGETPLLIAARWGKTDVIYVLVTGGANIGACDYRRWTAIHFAAVLNYWHMAKFLIGNNININAQDARGNTALHLLLRRSGDMEMVGLLLRKGANCNLVDRKGDTVFNLLTEKEAFGGIRLGILNGAYVTRYDYDILESNPLLKAIVLQRRQYCIQAVYNNFMCKAVPDLYRIPIAADVLPAMENTLIDGTNAAVREIVRAVDLEIDDKGYCNIITVKVLSLRIMCVNAFLKHYRNARVESFLINPPGVQTRSKRKAAEAFLAKKLLKSDG